MPSTCVPQTSRSLLAILGLSLGLFSAGCPDPEGRFEDFGDRYEEILNNATTTSSSAGAGGGTCDQGAVGDLDGEYLFALAANIGKKKPILFAATLTTSGGAEGLEFSLDLQPLLASDRKTHTGTSLVVGPFAIAEDGSFDAQLPTLNVPGNANPISGSDLEATVKLAGGVLCQPARWCNRKKRAAGLGGLSAPGGASAGMAGVFVIS